MQLEITLKGETGVHARTDLGYLLHKNPSRVHAREVASGQAYVFFSDDNEDRATATLILDVDPVQLVRGRSAADRGLLTQYVNDRPYAASSFLSVAINKCFAQTMAGKSKERQELAERALELEARIVPVGISGEEDIIANLFEPLGYDVHVSLFPTALDEHERRYGDVRLTGRVRISDLLNHIYVLLPVLDNAKHWWIDKAEVETLLSKGEGWLEQHPEKDFIAMRALKYRRALANLALARLNEADAQDDEPLEGAGSQDEKDAQEETLETPIRLHDLRLDTVAEQLASRGAQSVLDLGCGEGKLMARLIKERAFRKIVGVDASIATLERASRRLYLDRAGDAMRERVQLLQGSLTYADRRLMGFDAAALVEVIEHIDPWRLSSLAAALFGVTQPGLVLVTTPNREYNALFENLPDGKLRHPDHRFEWTRSEFADWCQSAAETFGYSVELSSLGPEHERLGGPSQMAVFERKVAA